jgi:TonB family protein
VPGSVRGSTVAVTFDVGADGRVIDVHFEPPLADRGFSRKLEDVMRGYRFRPARSPEGRAVTGRTTVTLIF